MGTPNCSVFWRVIFEKSEMLSWFGSLTSVVSPSTEVISSKLFGLMTCGMRGIGQVAKLLAARAEVRLTRAFGSGEVRQGNRGRQSREGGLEVTVKEQQGRRMKHEKGEGEMERYDMRTANNLSHACTRRVRHAKNLCQKNVRATRSVWTLPVAHTVVATTWVRNLESKKKKLRLRHSVSIFISPTKTWSTNLLSTDHHE